VVFIGVTGGIVSSFIYFALSKVLRNQEETLYYLQRSNTKSDYQPTTKKPVPNVKKYMTVV